MSRVSGQAPPPLPPQVHDTSSHSHVSSHSSSGKVEGRFGPHTVVRIFEGLGKIYQAAMGAINFLSLRRPLEERKAESAEARKRVKRRSDERGQDHRPQDEQEGESGEGSETDKQT